MKNTMKPFIHYPLLCAALLSVGLETSLFAQEPTASKDAPMGRLEVERTRLVAEVVSVNLTNREITLKGPQGNTVTLTAGDVVKRLDEVTGNPIGLVVGGGMKVYGEASGSATIEGRAKATAKEISDQLKIRFQEEGWIN
jgi:hypothetical protein